MEQTTKGYIRLQKSFTYRGVTYAFSIDQSTNVIVWAYNLGQIMGPQISTLIHGTAVDLPEMHTKAKASIDKAFDTYHGQTRKDAPSNDQYAIDNDSA